LETILVAYNEIALKSPSVRKRLERLLMSNILHILRRKGFDDANATRGFGRIYVEGAPLDSAPTVANVFGVASSMPAMKTTTDYDSVQRLTVEVANQRIQDGQSFAVRPRVVGDHPFSSQDLAVKLGSAVLEPNSARGVHVNLSEPDVTLYVEVRDRNAYVYTQIIKGVGGLPYGSQGRLVSLFSGGIDSPAAAWMMMKRGAEVLPLFMDQRPHVGESYVERVKDALRGISDYIPTDELALYVAPIGDLMGRISESPNPKLRCVLCKRSMYRIAAVFAEERNAKGIVTGESLGQVASQTLDNLFVLDEAVSIPVLRPTIGFDKLEIEEVAKKIGTYGISAVSVDGCTVVPSKPSTRSRLEEVRKLEEELGLLDLCSEASQSIRKVPV
jgi:thiamine biosynthesis protein ThiI